MFRCYFHHYQGKGTSKSQTTLVLIFLLKFFNKALVMHCLLLFLKNPIGEVQLSMYECTNKHK